MTEYLEFYVKITQNKKFYIPFSKAQELLKGHIKEDLNTLNETEIAEYLYYNPQIARYEDKDYCIFDNVEITDAQRFE